MTKRKKAPSSTAQSWKKIEQWIQTSVVTLEAAFGAYGKRSLSFSLVLVEVLATWLLNLAQHVIRIMNTRVDVLTKSDQWKMIRG